MNDVIKFPYVQSLNTALFQKSLHKILAKKGVAEWFHIMLVRKNENLLVFSEFTKLVGKD